MIQSRRTAPTTAVRIWPVQEVTTDETTDEADDDVTEQTKAETFEKNAGEPACNCSDEQSDDKS